MSRWRKTGTGKAHLFREHRSRKFNPGDGYFAECGQLLDQYPDDGSPRCKTCLRIEKARKGGER